MRRNRRRRRGRRPGDHHLPAHLSPSVQIPVPARPREHRSTSRGRDLWWLRWRLANAGQAPTSGSSITSSGPPDGSDTSLLRLSRTRCSQGLPDFRGISSHGLLVARGLLLSVPRDLWNDRKRADLSWDATGHSGNEFESPPSSSRRCALGSQPQEPGRISSQPFMRATIGSTRAARAAG